MDEQNATPLLNEAMQPYLDKSYEIVNATDTSAELFKPKKKMGWWVVVCLFGEDVHLLNL